MAKSIVKKDTSKKTKIAEKTISSTVPRQILDIGIPSKDRARIADGLSHLLADSYALNLKIHGFHWNVEGPQFSTLHTLFMEQYTELQMAVDEIAERIRALGFMAPASFGRFLALSSIQDQPDAPNAAAMIAEARAGHEAAARTARGIFPAAEAGGDQATCDLLTRRLALHEKAAWMLRALAA